MDTTFFKEFGLMLFRGAEIKSEKRNRTEKGKEKKKVEKRKSRGKVKERKTEFKFKNIYWKFVKKETLKNYNLALLEIKRKFEIKSFTVDNRGGLIQMLKRNFPYIPVQLCQFHQVARSLRYITRNPTNETTKDFKELVLKLKETNRKEFKELLNFFLQKHVKFIQERNLKGNYRHRKLRSAIYSLQENLLYIFKYKDHKNLNIPNTTNSLEGYFGQIKYKINLHRGLKEKRKKDLINEILKRDLFE